MIRVNGLTKVYPSVGITALNNVTLHIEKGDIFGVIGMSGAGKSTLLRCIGLLEEPTSGSVEIFGKDATGLKKREKEELRQSIGTVFQGYNLLMQRSVAKNVAFPLELHKKTRQEIRNRVGELLEMVGLSEKATAYPSQLSGGQKQRVAIARALATNPAVLLLDEPTSALDSFTTKSILGLIRELNEALGVTIVIITHEMRVVSEICNKVAVLDSNTLVETGETAKIMEQPSSVFTRRLLEAI